MQYIIMDDCNTDLFTQEFNNQKEAIKTASEDWSRMITAEKKQRKAFYLLKSVNPDDSAENHFDGEIIKKWK